MRFAFLVAALTASFIVATPARAQSLKFEAIWLGPTAAFVLTPDRSVDLGGEVSLFYGRPRERWAVGFALGGSEERVYAEALYSRGSFVEGIALPVATTFGLGPIYDHSRFNNVGAQLSLSEMIIPLLPITASVSVYPHEPPVVAVGISFMLCGGF